MKRKLSKNSTTKDAFKLAYHLNKFAIMAILSLSLLTACAKDEDETDSSEPTTQVEASDSTTSLTDDVVEEVTFSLLLSVDGNNPNLPDLWSNPPLDLIEGLSPHSLSLFEQMLNTPTLLQGDPQDQTSSDTPFSWTVPEPNAPELRAILELCSTFVDGDTFHLNPINLEPFISASSTFDLPEDVDIEILTEDDQTASTFDLPTEDEITNDTIAPHSDDYDPFFDTGEDEDDNVTLTLSLSPDAWEGLDLWADPPTDLIDELSPPASSILASIKRDARVGRPLEIEIPRQYLPELNEVLRSISSSFEFEADTITSTIHRNLEGRG